MSAQKIINDLSALDLSTATENDIISLVRQLGYTGKILTTLHPAYGEQGMPNLFARASNYDPKKEQVTSWERLRYPPKESNTRYQRASTPDRPMFYGVVQNIFVEKDGMAAIKAALLETISDYDEMVKNEMKVVLSLWYNICPINLYSVFSWKEFQSKNSEMQDIHQAFESFLNQHSPDFIKDTQIILDYLAKIFHLPVDTAEELYKPSAVLSQYLIERFGYYNVGGVIFPSVKVQGAELNVALTPVTCDQKLQLIKVMDCKYLPNGIVEIQKRGEVLPDGSLDFNEDLSIEIDLN